MLGGLLLLAIVGALAAAVSSHLRYRARNDEIFLAQQNKERPD